MQVNAAAISRRRAIALQLGLGGGVMAIAVVGGVIANKSDDDDVESKMDALELQRRTSWNVGDVDRRLTLTDGRTNDADGSEIWRTVLLNQRLADVLAPGEARLQPYYAPSLFQAPDQSADLRMDLTPMLRTSMEDVYDRGRALAEAFAAAGHPRDTALVIDMKGPEAVAVAAAVAPDFAPVFTFDNWPHPRGVVPSHETLAAALYYLPWLQRAAASRSTPAPPAFVLDANRLASYTDEVAHFDNRYAVSLPSASSLQAAGRVAPPLRPRRRRDPRVRRPERRPRRARTRRHRGPAGVARGFRARPGVAPCPRRRRADHQLHALQLHSHPLSLRGRRVVGVRLLLEPVRLVSTGAAARRAPPSPAAAVARRLVSTGRAPDAVLDARRGRHRRRRQAEAERVRSGVDPHRAQQRRDQRIQGAQRFVRTRELVKRRVTAR